MTKKNLEELQYINLFFKEDKKTNEFIETIKTLERFRMFLYKDFSKHLDLLKTAGADSTTLSNLKERAISRFHSEYDGKRIKIYIPDISPNIYIKTKNEAAAYFAERWKIEVADSIRQLKEYPNLKYEKVFIWIKHFNSVEFDGDNKLFKPIIDGICRSGIIQDDKNSIMKFGVEGILDKEKPHTEVFIFGDENIPDFIKNGIN